MSDKGRNNRPIAGGMVCSQHGLPILGMHSLYPTERFPKVSVTKNQNLQGLAAIPVCRECRL
jgi:hypothetical protein